MPLLDILGELDKALTDVNLKKIALDEAKAKEAAVTAAASKVTITASTAYDKSVGEAQIIRDRLDDTLNGVIPASSSNRVRIT